MTQSAGKSLQLLWSFEGIAFAPYPSTTDFPTPQNIFSHFELIPVYFCLIFFENLIRTNNDLVIHRQGKISDIISRRFGDFMTPLSRVQMRIKLTNAGSRVITDLHSGGGYTNTLARIESVCTFEFGVNCLM